VAGAAKAIALFCCVIAAATVDHVYLMAQQIDLNSHPMLGTVVAF